MIRTMKCIQFMQYSANVDRLFPRFLPAVMVIKI